MPNMKTLSLRITDFAKYVGPTVKSERNLTGPIKPTFFSDQMSAIVQDRISVFTDVRSGFPRFSSVAWFPVKVKIGQSKALAFPIDSNANFLDFHLMFHPFQYSLRQLVIHRRLRLHLNFLKITV